MKYRTIKTPKKEGTISRTVIRDAIKKVIKSKPVAMEWRCPKCFAYNITPFEKRVVDRKSICNYVCEACGHTWGPVEYSY